MKDRSNNNNNNNNLDNNFFMKTLFLCVMYFLIEGIFAQTTLEIEKNYPVGNWKVLYKKNNIAVDSACTSDYVKPILLHKDTLLIITINPKSEFSDNFSFTIHVIPLNKDRLISDFKHGFVASKGEKSCKKTAYFLYTLYVYSDGNSIELSYKKGLFRKRKSYRVVNADLTGVLNAMLQDVNKSRYIKKKCIKCSVW